MPAPFLIPAILGGLQLAKGIYDDAQAKKEQRQADAAAAAIPREDAGVRSMLDQIRQRRRYAELGQNAMLGYKRRVITDAGLNAARNMARAAGTSPGAAQQSFLRSQNVTQQNLAGAAAQSEALAPQYLSMETPIVQDMADRKLALDQYRRDSLQMRAAQRQMNANNAIMGAFGLAAFLEANGTPGSGTGTGKTGDADGSGNPFNFIQKSGIANAGVEYNGVLSQPSTPSTQLSVPYDGMPRIGPNMGLPPIMGSEQYYNE